MISQDLAVCDDFETRQEARRRSDWLDWFVSAVGSRYAKCRLDTFQATTDKQRAAVEAIKEYAGDLANRIAEGQNILLYGASGTGKDHLLVGLAGYAIQQCGIRVEYRYGLDLFDAFRSTVDGKQQTASGLLAELTAPPVLYLSDPTRPTGSLSQFETDWLLRVIHRRYSECRPTWLTCNVQNGKELAERIGAPAFDRLRDGALTLFCDWGTYRKAGLRKNERRTPPLTAQP